MKRHHPPLYIYFVVICVPNMKMASFQVRVRKCVPNIGTFCVLNFWIIITCSKEIYFENKTPLSFSSQIYISTNKKSLDLEMISCVLNIQDLLIVLAPSWKMKVSSNSKSCLPCDFHTLHTLCGNVFSFHFIQGKPNIIALGLDSKCSFQLSFILQR